MVAFYGSGMHSTTFWVYFGDTLTGHIALVSYLLAVADEKTIIHASDARNFLFTNLPEFHLNHLFFALRVR